ncbi:ATP-binding protein [Streptomyces sp. 150FB]|uniref:sensor histidine kinase n=1 Tax=Streptomyces sp. 150FB TaxID=1576605 RepID=UPI001F490288|nr:ATP-binding protein [Streptomyces sp. 150FB]
MLLLLALCGAWIFAHSTAVNNRLVDRSTPALIASVRLESALVNQETGIRGYGMTGRDEFITPYREGLVQQRTTTRELGTLDGDDETAAKDLAEVSERAAHWQTMFAEPVAASDRPVALAASRAEEGKRDFDAVRAAISTQQRHLQAERTQGRADLQQVRALRNWTFAAIAAVILLLTALVFIGLRRGVTTPVDRLSADVRKIADGDFAHPVTGTGPADLRRLAADVESMRRRLADELAFSDSARASLGAQAAELRRSNSELEQFAYVASHDLQEPLRKVASFCQLLERRYGDQLDARAKQYIAFAVDGANRMQGLINDLLAFSRVGRLLADHSAVDLAELFDRTQESIALAVEESEAVVTHDPLPTVHGDRTQLGMLLQNLLGNAVKFRSPERPPLIHLGARRTEGGWEFTMSDNGIGISAEYAERVFVIFQRLHTREQYTGNGIGLALCKKIVEYHGGAISVGPADPDRGPGTRVTFTLPDPPDPGDVTGESGEALSDPPASLPR